MKAFLISFLAVLLATGGMALIVEQRTQTRLRADVARLKRQSSLVNRLEQEHRSLAGTALPAEELESLRHDQKELERLRGIRESLRSMTKMREDIRATAGPPKPLGPGMTALTDFGEAGTSSPAAAEQTFFSALAQIDPDAMAKQLVLTADARTKAEKLLASLDEDTRAKMGTPEKLMAYYLVGLLGRVSGVQMLGQQATGPDQATWTARLQMVSGRTNDYSFTVRRVGDSWREEIPAGMVDHWWMYLLHSVAKN